MVLDGLVNGFREEVFGAPKPTRGLSPAGAVEAVSKLVEVLVSAGFAIRVGSPNVILDLVVTDWRIILYLALIWLWLSLTDDFSALRNILRQYSIKSCCTQGDVSPMDMGFSVTFKGPINQWGKFSVTFKGPSD